MKLLISTIFILFLFIGGLPAMDKSPGVDQQISKQNVLEYKLTSAENLQSDNLFELEPQAELLFQLTQCGTQNICKYNYVQQEFPPGESKLDALFANNDLMTNSLSLYKRDCQNMNQLKEDIINCLASSQWRKHVNYHRRH